jgi:hypothetical protein
MMQNEFKIAFFLGLTFLLFGYNSEVSQAIPLVNVPPEAVVFIKPDWTGPEPDWADFADESYPIYWKDQDTDSNADITLFYDNDQNSENGNLGTIRTGIKENDGEGQSEFVWNTGQIPEGSYRWNTTSIPNGAYYLGAIISDRTTSVTSYSVGKVRVHHFPKISTPYPNPGLASVWSEVYPDNPQLIHRQTFFRWDELEPCGDDNYFWKRNPLSGRFYADDDGDGVCEDNEGSSSNRFKERFMERLYKRIDPACKQNCDFKRPLELLRPEARVYIHINGLGPDTLQFNSLTGKYEKRAFWLFNTVALLRTPDGDYNVNGRRYPSVQFWDPEYQEHYQDLLVDFATELKKYDEIYPYVSFVRAQLNAFNAESGNPEDGRCELFASVKECVDYGYNFENYDPETRYNAALAKEYYIDTRNQQQYYYREANDYHEWVAKTYFDLFKNDPDGKLQAEIVIKPFPADEDFTPPPIEDGFLYKMIYEYGVWFYKTNMIATGQGQNDNLTRFVHDKKIARGYTEPSSTYNVQSDPVNIIPARYDNPLQWVYWHALLDLHRGVDVISYYGNITAKCRPGKEVEYCEVFDFLNQYAGEFFSPATADGAWIAFRPLYYPAYLDGDLERHLTLRDADQTSNRIFGYESCKGDPDCGNDVNLNPPKPASLNCSQAQCPNDGYFGDMRNGRVVSLGPKSQPYGIWARSIGANDKQVMTLDVNDEFARSVSGRQGIKINIIYLDSGDDTFTLKYKNSDGAAQTVVFDKNNTGTWKGDQEAEAIEIWDFGFDNSLNGGDVQLLSNQDGEDIFHMVKIVKGEGIAIRTSPSVQAIEPGGTASYTVQVLPANFPFPITLALADPPPDLTLTLTPKRIISGTTATLTVVDHHPGPTLMPGLWYILPITGTGGGFTSTTSVDLLVGGSRTYLPIIPRNDSP